MTHLVLDQTFDSKAFNKFINKRNWNFLGVFEADPDNGQAAQIICQDPETKVKCYYVEDYLIDLRYLILEGKKEKELASELLDSKDIKLVSPEKIAGKIEAGKSKKDLILGLRMLAVISPEKYDPDYFKLFRAGLDHKDPAVRHASIKIVTYPNWKQLYAEVKKKASVDTDPQVKALAAGFVREYDKLNKKKSASVKKSSATKKSSAQKSKVR